MLDIKKFSAVGIHMTHYERKSMSGGHMAIFRRDVLALLRFWLTSCWFAREVRVDFA